MAKKKAVETTFAFNDNINILIVEGRFYEEINTLLLEGAKAVLDASRVKYKVLTVPGALEVPQAINMGIATGAFHGAIALGCVIRGETGHYDVVVNESNRALMVMSIDTLFPIGNGILTVENEAQALERADPKRLNKGAAAAQAVLALIKIDQDFEAEHGERFDI